ncbi:Kinase D-interacting substrate of 220 kDa [Talaromyces islandicus]|uniref:Kinase D-interacting substrate of 220 kDa n=1 Tax=Talaromyces islandicus TaxID=28573 RepID=A0A0U1LN60_TALIS|nr:Kinase D-interacting substrate of 220 kDa [Talaromyces islandicus]
MRAAILSLMGIAPTAVLGASYLATNTSQFIGVWIPDDAPTPVLVGNGTSVQDRAATIQTKDGILEFERPVNGTAHTWQTVVNQASGSLGFATKNNGITPTPGFSFAKDGTLYTSSFLAMAVLDDIPSEILHQIAGHIEYKIDLFALAQADRRLCLIANERLYKNLQYVSINTFFWAVENGKEECVRRFLQAGIQVPSFTPVKFHPIIIAAEKGYAGIVRLLLEDGVDPNLSHRKFCEPLHTPLTAAAREGHDSVVKLLIDHHADLELSIELSSGQESKAITQPLSTAVKNHHVSLVKLFLDHGCNPLTPDYDDEGNRKGCAWETAAGTDLDILRMFTDKGFEPELTSPTYSHLSRHLELLKEAIRSGDAPLTKFLFAKAPDALPPDNKYHDMLLSALKKGRVSVFKFLLNLKPEFTVLPHPYNDVYETVRGNDDILYAIGDAAGKSPLDTEFLLQTANLNRFVEEKNLRPIVCLTVGAANGENEEFMKRLLDIEWVKRAEGENWIDLLSCCLTKAAWLGHYGLVELLLDYGADPSGAVKCTQGYGTHKPPIHAAAQQGFADVFRLLLDRGAYTGSYTFVQQPRMLLDNILYEGEVVSEARVEMVRLLVERDSLIPKGGDGDSRILVQAAKGGAEIFQLVLQHIGAELHAGYCYHEDAFEVSVRMAEITVMEMFLKAGFDPNSKTAWNDQTAKPTSFLRLAAKVANPPGIGEQAVDLLLKYGADVNWRDPRTNEPPHYCLDDPEVVRLLLKKGADPLCTRNPKGDSMLLDATRFGVSSTVKVLLQGLDEQDISFEKAGPIVEEAIRDKKRSGRNPKATQEPTTPPDGSTDGGCMYAQPYAMFSVLL